MTTQPKLSIITINYNNKTGLIKTLESVISQTYKEFEYIVIDGGSTDGSKAYLETQHSHFEYWVSEPDEGIYDAMNKGIQQAKGDYCLFLNSGDCLASSTTLSYAQDFIRQNPNHDIYYANILVKSNDPKQQTKTSKLPEKLSLYFFSHATINHQASIIKSELFDEMGLYPLGHKLAADYWLFLISFIRNKKFKHIKFDMILYDVSGISTNNFDAYRKEMDKIWKEVVPQSVEILLKENKIYKQLLNFSIIKAAIILNKHFQKYKFWN